MAQFALVDCNNFYASCERAFNPRLENKPIIVLSNNDGCIIARSNEAKQLNIPMGGAFFQWRDFCKQHGVFAFSSNYALYGDMSYRVMQLLQASCHNMEIYSIDEAFLETSHIPQDTLCDYALTLSQEIKRSTGIPVSIGIASTKTLAKIANYLAKKISGNGTFHLSNDICDSQLAQVPIQGVWGIGRRLSKRMQDINILTAYDLKQADLKTIRSQFGVVLEKMVRELRGISCLPLESIQPKKQIMSSRSFGRAVMQLSDLEEAVSHYAAKACVKLRAQESVAKGISVFIQTSLHGAIATRYANSVAIHFSQTTHDSSLIIKTAVKALRTLFKPGFRYQKAGVMLLDISPHSRCQYDWLSPTTPSKKNQVMALLDTVNRQHGKGSLFLASEGTMRTWQIRSDHRSPRYTTQWDELAIAHCDT